MKTSSNRLKINEGLRPFGEMPGPGPNNRGWERCLTKRHITFGFDVPLIQIKSVISLRSATFASPG